MENLTKKSIATFFLLIVITISVFADGDGQCPDNPPPCGDGQCPPPCLLDSTTIKNVKEYKESEIISGFLAKLFEKVGFLF